MDEKSLKKYSRNALLGSFVSMLTAGLATMMYSVCLGTIQTELSLTAAQSGSLATYTFMGQMLGGMVAGYIADRICDYLKNQGVEKAVINLGGNVAVLGEKAKDTPWNIAIERPYSDRTEMMGYVSVKDATVVTSGIYERKFEQDGVLYHHVLDPRSGYPVDTDLEAVTIRAARGNSGFCDGLSTVCLMLGRDKAQALIQTLQEEHPEMKLEAAFIDKNDAMTQTDGMDVKKDE